VRSCEKSTISRHEAIAVNLPHIASYIQIPHFFEKAKLWHDPATGNGNPAFVSWLHAHEYLIIPPDDYPRQAWKVSGRVCAIREAAREAIII
jgi:predicted PhzF superfamily epimerase YddE/YHI9